MIALNMKSIFVPARQVAGISGALLVLAALLTAGCQQQSAQQQPPGGAQPPPSVGVVTVTSQSVPLTTELPGRIEAIRTAEVRARVSGILLKETYREGSDVKAGDVLFQI